MIKAEQLGGVADQIVYPSDSASEAQAKIDAAADAQGTVRFAPRTYSYNDLKIRSKVRILGSGSGFDYDDEQTWLDGQTINGLSGTVFDGGGSGSAFVDPAPDGAHSYGIGHISFQNYDKGLDLTSDQGVKESALIHNLAFWKITDVPVHITNIIKVGMFRLYAQRCIRLLNL